MGEAASPALALRDLRRARHHRHQADVDWVETLYRVYVTVLSGAAVIWLSASKVSDAIARKGGAGRHPGPRGRRPRPGRRLSSWPSGCGRGAGAGRCRWRRPTCGSCSWRPSAGRLALRAPALRQVRSAAFSGLCFGAVVGNLAGHRLPGRFAGWVAADAGFGLVAAVRWPWVWPSWPAGCGCPGRRPAPLGAAVLAWSAADLAAGTVTSPLTVVGRLGLGPLPGDVRGGPLGLAVGGRAPRWSSPSSPWPPPASATCRWRPPTSGAGSPPSSGSP